MVLFLLLFEYLRLAYWFDHISYRIWQNRYVLITNQDFDQPPFEIAITGLTEHVLFTTLGGDITAVAWNEIQTEESRETSLRQDQNDNKQLQHKKAHRTKKAKVFVISSFIYIISVVDSMYFDIYRNHRSKQHETTEALMSHFPQQTQVNRLPVRAP